MSLLAPALIATIPGLQAALDAKAPTVNPAFTGALAAAAGTLTNPAPNQITQTWNDAADTFTAFQVNVTDTASAGVSNLLDLQVGGVSRFSVRKDGAIFPQGVIDCGNWIGTSGYFWAKHNSQNYYFGPDQDTAINRTAAGKLKVIDTTTGFVGELHLKLRLGTDAAPATAAAAGVAGETRWDASYLYLCTAANTWKRAALDTW